jgi:hypothetical protein
VAEQVVLVTVAAEELEEWSYQMVQPLLLEQYLLMLVMVVLEFMATLKGLLGKTQRLAQSLLLAAEAVELGLLAQAPLVVQVVDKVKILIQLVQPLLKLQLLH